MALLVVLYLNLYDTSFKTKFFFSFFPHFMSRKQSFKSTSILEKNYFLYHVENITVFSRVIKNSNFLNDDL